VTRPGALVPVRAPRATPRQTALAWLLARPPVKVPIPGTGSMAHREGSMGAAIREWSPDEVATLVADERGT
jgi:pyridoxine 4-dehydrogenase